MKLRMLGLLFGILGIFLCTPVHATHIHFLDYSVLSTDNPVTLDAGETYEYTFSLTTDAMPLSEVGTGIDLGTGSYDPEGDLHYVYLRIDPNDKGGNEGALQVTVNGTVLADWENPISVYDWGVPGGSIDDPFDIISLNYMITVNLKALETIEVYNINLEGCFEAATPVPEPFTMLLLGSGLAGFAGIRRKFGKK